MLYVVSRHSFDSLITPSKSYVSTDDAVEQIESILFSILFNQSKMS